MSQNSDDKAAFYDFLWVSVGTITVMIACLLLLGSL